ncbi:substrate import-associated zinc metallohydrolase lipoprotein [Saccharicrinis aurantiacus]|uniref:substrate import-associated zinc metallohydrolase lipoprotein n=1 Tax=Saccharicrinis aurantiacus TaxID=1849719 RepID=UPI0024901A86|nr:substrate import-associated zinc metallohydrolase lipoprotein [Saccharicrinis aurantiacus]
MKNIKIIHILLLLVFITSCNDDEAPIYVPDELEESTDLIDVYFKDNFLEPYGTAVRWRWDDKLVDNSKRVTPIKREFCIPMGNFIKNFWIAPFEKTEDGKSFIYELFPPEVMLIGSPMYNSDGESITLGYADAGVRITFTQVNEYDLGNPDWVLMQLRTAEHEFGHIVHQNYNLPNGLKEVTPANYKSNNWLNLAGDVQQSNPRISREAISLGMVSNYGTSDVNEDFCELLSIYITSEVAEFEERYLTHEPEEIIKLDDGTEIEPNADAVEVNKGRDFIAIKLKLVKDYYWEKFKIDLDVLRDEIVFRLKNPNNPNGDKSDK